MMQTLFGLTLLPTRFPLAPTQAHALSDRIAAAARQVQNGAPTAFAAEARRDAVSYLDARRSRQLRLPLALERAADEGARALLRLTVGIPPLPARAELLVA